MHRTPEECMLPTSRHRVAPKDLSSRLWAYPPSWETWWYKMHPSSRFVLQKLVASKEDTHDQSKGLCVEEREEGCHLAYFLFHCGRQTVNTLSSLSSLETTKKQWRGRNRERGNRLIVVSQHNDWRHPPSACVFFACNRAISSHPSFAAMPRTKKQPSLGHQKSSLLILVWREGGALSVRENMMSARSPSDLLCGSLRHVFHGVGWR